MSKSIEREGKRPEWLGNRGALLVLLAGLAGGFGVGYRIGKSGENEGQETSKKSEQVQDPKVVDCPKPAPLAEASRGVDAEQCRVLFAEMLKDPNWKPVLSDAEVKKKAEEIEQKRLAVVADEIIAKLCITNPEDEKGIREMTSKGFESGLDVFVDKGGGAHLSMNKTVGTCFQGESVDLSEKPPCELKRDPKAIDAEKLFEDIMAGRHGSILEKSVNGDKIEKRAAEVGLLSESSVRDLVSLAREVKGQLSNPNTMKEESCRMISRLAEIHVRWQALPQDRKEVIETSGVYMEFGLFWITAADTYKSKGGKVEECAPATVGMKLFRGKPMGL